MVMFCRLMIGSGLGMTFISPPGMSPALVDAELLELMATAGWYRVCLSVDVGTNKAARYSRKPVKIEKVRALVRSANRIGLWTYGTFVIGYEFEDASDIAETVRFAYWLKLDAVIFYIAQAHMGSELYDRMVASGRVKADINDSHSPAEAMMGTDHVSAAYLEAVRKDAQEKYLVRHLWHLLSPLYLLTEFLPKLWPMHRFRYARKVVGTWFELIRLRRSA
jgi:radical SAM superfamily enzyme YgiQ (UPF0313 family)